MHQPLTIAKVRKETEVTVPAGGWVILVSPDKPFGDHQSARTAIAAKGPVNDEFEVVVCGRMDNKFADLKLVTKKEDEEARKMATQTDKDFAKFADDAKAREAKMDAEKAKKEAEEHQKRVAEINKFNDEIRNRK